MHQTPDDLDMFVHRQLTRRQLVGGVVATLASAGLATKAGAADVPADPIVRSPKLDSSNAAMKAKPTEMGGYDPEVLPPGIRSRFVNDVNGLRIHVLEAGFEGQDRPCVLLLHGFPELAYSWRKVMLPIAAAGFHVVAPDQRGYGRTTGWDGEYDGDLSSFRFLNLVRDALGLVSAFGYRSVAAVVGHDFGSPVAAWCALLRPDVFRSVVLMSAPFAGPPSLPFNTVNEEPRKASQAVQPRTSIHDELAALKPPRKHYQWYYSTREADGNMRNCPQGIHAFLRAYYHYKSADWKENRPFPLKSWTAQELAKLPTYYIMELDQGMAETVAPRMPSATEIAECKWLPDERDSKVVCSGIGVRQVASSSLISKCSPAARSMCRPASSPGKATGDPTKGQGTWNKCRIRSALKCRAAICWRELGIGSSRSSRKKSADC
jgi:pimeloyl-ACP methyl ester carboxylesterase